ncbi:MAG: GNAT family N-acetyltransferase [Betaproteobacteria bacterium]
MTAVPKLVFRRPNPALFAQETAEVAELFIASRAQSLPRVKRVHSNEEIRDWMREVVFPRRSIRIAQLADEIVGFAARDGAWLEHLYIKPAWTGKGIGRELLDIVVAEARMVTPVLRLYTFQCNAGARRFYERHGFAAVEFSDGSTNEEKEPDVRYERPIR